MKTQSNFSKHFASALAAIHACGGETLFFESRRDVAVAYVRSELSFIAEAVDEEHPVVRALLHANAVTMGEPSGAAEVCAHMLDAWEHYEGKGRASGAPGRIA